MKKLANGQIVLPFDTTSELNRWYGQASPVLALDRVICPPMRLAWGNEASIGRISAHPLVAHDLADALFAVYTRLGAARWRSEGWERWGGCFNYRRKRGGSRELSIHSWAIGPDIDPDRNPFKDSRHTLSDEGISIMELHGFLSGGRAWGHDYMHFQAAMPSIVKGSYYSIHGLPPHILRAGQGLDKI